MDYYTTLGLQRGASDAEIKKAYRSMAMKHHPDRGGDEKKFKEISQAYEFLTDPQKKQMIDMGADPNQQQHGGFHHAQANPFEFHFGAGDIHEMFGNFGFGNFGGRNTQKNKTLSIAVEIALEDVLKGKEINAEVGIPNGPRKMINIHIPAGIESGQQIRYDGMGDNSIPHLRPGDLIVNIIVRPHPVFRREGISLIYDHVVSAWDAMIGSDIDIRTLDGKQLKITVPSGTQPDTVLSCRGEGLPDVRSRQRGNLLIKIKVEVPRNLTPTQISRIQQIKNEL
jgi:DnaJ-class molecular chaperone